MTGDLEIVDVPFPVLPNGVDGRHARTILFASDPTRHR
jgi:hypothetical protein